MDTSKKEVDLRLTQLSYSSLLTLHSCGRKFELDKKMAKKNDILPDDTSALTFAYGHAVGTGIQDVLMRKSDDEIYFNMFRNWSVDLLEDNPKQQKSFGLAMHAVQKLQAMMNAGFLDDYELLEYNGRPAVELGFRIVFPDGFMYRGFVDAVLRHKVTGRIIVLENKTSSMQNLNGAVYKNSAQAIGYSIVLNAIAPGTTDYTVIYLVYKTKDREYEILEFEKSFTQRARWIQELLLDIETIKLYDSADIFPMRGESCFSFYRECEYYGICNLKTKNLVAPLDEMKVAEKILAESFDVELTLVDLLQSQLEEV